MSEFTAKELTAGTVDMKRGIDRRTIVKGAAWSAPVVALAMATPAMAASVVDVGAFTVNGTCGTLGLVNPGFNITAGTGGLPVGTVITLNGSGFLSVGLFTVTGATASVVALGSNNTQQVTLTSALPAGGLLELRTLVSVGVAYGFSANLTLPTGYVAGAGAKPVGGFGGTTVLNCTAS